MTIYRVQHNKNYTVINNSICSDTRISFKAKGIWLYAFSRPDDWSFCLQDLINQGTNGKDSVVAGLQELENTGYLIRTRIRDEKGRLGSAEWTFFETPQFTEEKTSTDTFEPKTGLPNLVNPPLLNTETQSLPNTDKDNVFRDSGNVHKSKSPQSKAPAKKTMPLSIDKKGTMDASRRWKLSPEQSETYEFLKNAGIDSQDGTFVHWAKTYSMERIIDVFNEAKSKGATSIGAYMQKLLKTQANVSQSHSQDNKRVAWDLKKKWPQLTINQKYCTFPKGSGKSELEFNMQPLDFYNSLMKEYEFFTQKG